ncbi:hypothetical protein BDV26DRAFT_262214 [Aspergillus bertholletiae]|uniref:Arrestin-like N-terminal domain-containing protein n=1 Tax=Aspergillus bertholletiae TaxID=1226010 RepID=A0A5N7B8J4_9EURO|nr:hypothetical protein BDV26DRAFT_262214 [Aspergillus bertholletiae]
MSITDIFTVDIALRTGQNNTHESYLYSHLTGDKIHGVVTVRSHSDVQVDGIEVSFIGEERTILQTGKAHRQFQDIKVLIDEAQLPPGKLFKERHKYHFGFTFEVPDHLSPDVCNHKITSPAIRLAHLRPPPSFGDPSVSGFGGKLKDDYAPPTCRILYTIQATLFRNIPVIDRWNILLVHRIKLRVKPAVDEWPTLDLMSSMNDYCLETDRAIVDSRSKEEYGQLTVALEPPKGFRLPLRDPHSLISNTVNLFLHYRVTGGQSDLPQLQSFRGQIIATTFYTASHYEDVPTKKKDFFGRPKNYCETPFPPFAYSIASLDWAALDDNCYVATLLVPVTLPRLNFIPSFHTCLTSRVYSLDLRLVVPGAAPFHLKAPVHIYAERDPSALPSYIATVGIDA